MEERDKKPAYTVILDEIERRFEVEAEIREVLVKGGYNSIAVFEDMATINRITVMGQACCLLELLMLIPIPLEATNGIVERLSKIFREHNHVLVYTVIQSLLSTEK